MAAPITSTEPRRSVAGPRLRILALTTVAALGASVATVVTLLGSDEGASHAYTTVRGETVEIFGQGLYRYDSLLVGSGNLGVDLVTLVLAVPLVVVFAVLYGRGSKRGELLLAGMLGFLAYVYAGRTLGTTAYNDLFLVYVIVFAASVLALFLLLASLGSEDPFRAAALPRRAIAAIVLAIAGVTTALWLEAPITALLGSASPATLDHYTTLFTHGLDLAVVVPLLTVSGIMIARRRTLGYLAAVPPLVLVAMLAPTLTSMTMHQVRAGVELTTDEIVVYVASFVALGLSAAWAVWRLIAVLPRTGARLESAPGSSSNDRGRP